VHTPRLHEATGSPNRGGIASQLSAPGDFLGRRPLSLQFAIPSPGDLLQGTLPRPRSFLNCRRSSSRAVGPERGLFTGRKLGRLRSECQGIHRAEPGVCSARSGARAYFSTPAAGRQPSAVGRAVSAPTSNENGPGPHPVELPFRWVSSPWRAILLLAKFHNSFNVLATIWNSFLADVLIAP
jgi:hypothetical protein